MPKQAPLVCQHLENISRDALGKYQRTIRRYIKGRQGLYALYRGNRLYYAGLTTNLRFRLRHHLNDRHSQSWDRFSIYLTLGDTPLRELEALVLRIGRPVGNKQLGKFMRSEDLRQNFSRAIRTQQRKEHDLIIGRNRIDWNRPKESKPSGQRTPALARYADQLTILRAKFKGRTVRARIRKNGTIRLDGKIYRSPSLAAAAACRRPTCNGWTFWSYERAPGDWVPLNQLREN